MARTYDLRLPRQISEGPGLEFSDSPEKNWVRKRGEIADLMVAMRPQNTPLGVHASNYGTKKSLCGVPLERAETVLEGAPEKVAARVTCQFCQARLVNAGVLDKDADHVRRYAKDYGTR